MADAQKRLASNVEGEFFVDSSCINCDACRQLAPETFREEGGYSTVYRQPQSQEARRRAVRALLSCPTGSIGAGGGADIKTVMDDFPLLLEDGVYYCGFNSARSYGGNSYFIRHGGGNWLVDSPRYLPHLVSRFEEMGGLSFIFLTHRDDVADAHRFAGHFGARRVIHRAELDSQPQAELVIDGLEPVELSPRFIAIPTPGHTEGHMVLLYDERFLFSGDTLSLSRSSGRLAVPSRRYCWYSWEEQANSLRRLERYRFQWLLPGHGQRGRLDEASVAAEIEAVVDRMLAVKQA